VVAAPASKRSDPETAVPWSRYSLINWFNTWKKTEAAAVDLGRAPLKLSLQDPTTAVGYV
jgi:hypothetical protein